MNQGPKGAFVYLVGPGNKAVAQPVTVITTEGDTAVIKDGVQPGQLVVTDGQMALRPGAVVSYGGGAAGAGGGAGGRPPHARPGA